jgi:hypothetical protein
LLKQAQALERYVPTDLNEDDFDFGGSDSTTLFVLEDFSQPAGVPIQPVI